MARPPKTEGTDTPKDEAAPPSGGNSQSWDALSSRVGVHLDQVGDILKSRLTQLGLIAGALVTVQGGLTSCGNDNIARYQAFKTAFDNEQTYWKDRYSEYLETIDARKDVAGGEARAKEWRQEKLLALDALTRKPVPEFSEYKLGFFYNDDRRQSQANAYFSYLKCTLHSAIWGRSTGGQYIVNAGFENANSDRLRRRDASGNAVNTVDSSSQTDGCLRVAPVSEPDQTVQSSAVSPAPPPIEATANLPGPPSLSYDTRVLTYGQSNGYDLDVFWCLGDNEGQNFDLANKVGQYLTAEATAESPGMLIGRVRVRPLPVDKQGAGYPKAPAIEVRYDENEEGVAKRLSTLIHSGANVDFAPVGSRSGTNWYLSLFVCTRLPPETKAPVKKAS